MADNKKHRGPDPIIIPRKITEWINSSCSNPVVNNYKKGGGKKQK